MSGAQEEDPSIFGMIRQSRRHRRSWRTSELPSIAVLARYRRRSKRYRPRSIDRRLGRSASSRGPIPLVSSDWAPRAPGEIRRRARVRYRPHRAGSRCGRPGPTRGAGFHGGDHRQAGRRALAQGGKALDPDPRRISGAGPLPGRTHQRPTSRPPPFRLRSLVPHGRDRAEASRTARPHSDPLSALSHGLPSRQGSRSHRPCPSAASATLRDADRVHGGRRVIKA